MIKSSDFSEKNSEKSSYADKIVEIWHNFKNATFKGWQDWAAAVNKGFNAAEVVFFKFRVDTHPSQFIWENTNYSRLMAKWYVESNYLLASWLTSSINILTTLIKLIPWRIASNFGSEKVKMTLCSTVPLVKLNKPEPWTIEPVNINFCPTNSDCSFLFSTAK